MCLQTLIEVAQHFAGGRRRVRNLPLSEKMKPDEQPCEAAARGIREELSSYITADTEIDVQTDTVAPHSLQQSVSKSYPGLTSKVCSLSLRHVLC